MSDRLPVIAAIANYNMAQELAQLLPQVAAQGYDAVYVLDDASTDASREVVTGFSREIRFVAGESNRGAGANRNRIVRALGADALIHFLDADTRIESARTAEAVRDVVPSEPFGFIGGLSKTVTGLQSVWNYGPRQSLKADIGANVQAHLEPLMLTDPDRARRLQTRFGYFLTGWPDPLREPKRQPVYWSTEQSLIVRSDIFAKIGGFDERLREHEIQDLAIRMAHQGLQRLFDPAIAIVHTAAQVRNYNRLRAMLAAEVYINRKHGLRNWLLARDSSLN